MQNSVSRGGVLLWLILLACPAAAQERAEDAQIPPPDNSVTSREGS